MLLFVHFLLAWVCDAQIAYNPDTNSLICSKINGSFCVGSSLETNVMMSCNSPTEVEIRACDIELSRVVPAAYKMAAVCYESSSSAGDAVCAFNGTGYYLSGTRIFIPGSILCQSARPPSANDDVYLLNDMSATAIGSVQVPPSPSANVGGLVSRCINPWRASAATGALLSSSGHSEFLHLLPTAASVGTMFPVHSPPLLGSPTTCPRHASLSRIPRYRTSSSALSRPFGCRSLFSGPETSFTTTFVTAVTSHLLVGNPSVSIATAKSRPEEGPRPPMQSFNTASNMQSPWKMPILALGILACFLAFF